MSIATLNNVILRIVVDPNFITKGSKLTFEELDSNIKIITDAIREVTEQDVAGVEPYNAGTEYSQGDFVSYSGNIWEFINVTPATGVTPSTDPLTWQLSSTGAFAHQQGTDQFLDEGGPNEVSAADLASLVTGFTAPYGRLLFVDGINGNDGGAAVGNPLAPYLTLTAAKTAAVSGDLILVNPATYDEKNLLKNGVNWFFYEGAEVVYTGGSDGAIFDDDAVTGSNGAVTCSVLGYGVFDRQGTGNAGSFKGGVYLTNNSNNIIIRGKKLAANVNVFHILGDLNTIDVNVTEKIDNVITWGIFHNEGDDLNARIKTKEFNCVDATTEQFLFNNGDDCIINVEGEVMGVAGTGSSNPDIEILGVGNEVTIKGLFINYVPVAIGVNRWEVNSNAVVKFIDCEVEDILETILISGTAKVTVENCDLAFGLIAIDTSGTELHLKNSIVDILGSPAAVQITTAKLILENSTLTNILGAPSTHAVRFVDQGAIFESRGVSFLFASGAFSSLSFDGNHGGTSNQIIVKGSLHVNRPLGGTTLPTTSGGGIFIDDQAQLMQLTNAQTPNMVLATDAGGYVQTVAAMGQMFTEDFTLMTTPPVASTWTPTNVPNLPLNTTVFIGCTWTNNGTATIGFREVGSVINRSLAIVKNSVIIMPVKTDGAGQVELFASSVAGITFAYLGELT